MESVIVGFIGGANNSRGLIKCVTKDQIDIVIKQGRKKGASLSSSTIKQAKKERKTEIKENLKMTTFYEEKGFKTGKELLQVDIHSLGLNLDETALDSSNRTVTLREVAESILDEINKHLENGSEEATIIRNRNILINTNLATCTCSPYRHIGLRKDGVKDSEQTWVRQIMRALVENQHVYKFIADNSYGIHIQA